MTKIQDENPPMRSLLDLVLELGEERGVAKGVQEGMQQGMQRGAEGALRTLLVDQLRMRFGALPDGAAARIDAADAETLRRWCLRVSTASDCADVFADA